eukprot:jgi/Bigna1/139824/aug1.52_g14532
MELVYDSEKMSKEDDASAATVHPSSSPAIGIASSTSSSQAACTDTTLARLHVEIKAVESDIEKKDFEIERWKSMYDTVSMIVEDLKSTKSEASELRARMLNKLDAVQSRLEKVRQRIPSARGEELLKALIALRDSVWGGNFEEQVLSQKRKASLLTRARGIVFSMPLPTPAAVLNHPSTAIPPPFPPPRQHASSGEQTVDIERVTDLYGQTAMHHLAAMKKPVVYTKMLARLCKVRPDQVDRRDRELKTPLHVAVNSTNLAAVKTLVHHGASCTTLDRSGQSPLLTAVWCLKHTRPTSSYANSEIVSFLTHHAFLEDSAIFSRTDDRAQSVESLAGQCPSLIGVSIARGMTKIKKWAKTIIR